MGGAGRVTRAVSRGEGGESGTLPPPLLSSLLVSSRTCAHESSRTVATSSTLLPALVPVDVSEPTPPLPPLLPFPPPWALARGRRGERWACDPASVHSSEAVAPVPPVGPRMRRVGALVPAARR